jgi:ATP-dependent helicase YprA (DUF1998 family)
VQNFSHATPLAALAAPADVNINVRPVVDAVQDPQLARQQQITRILTQALPQLVLEANQLIPLHRMPSTQFLEPLNDEQKTDVLRGCLLVFILSHGKAVPRDFQLQACLGPLEGRDTILCSGTGSGKTLVLILLLLLRPSDVSLLIVPLKRLQLAQVSQRVIIKVNSDF